MLPGMATLYLVGAPAALSAPFVPRIDSAQGYCGGAIGYGPNTVRSALCELLERSHFSDLIKGKRSQTLKAAYGDQAAMAFATAFRQTCLVDECDHVDEHAFEVVPAVNLLGGEDTFLPLVTVSLANVRDDPYLPYRDSTGCACHFDPDLALDGALLEFYERQCLVASTLLGRCRARMTIDAETRCPADLRDMVAPLLNGGKIRVAEIGLHQGAYVVLATYEGPPDAVVRYSVGCSASFDPIKACKKAFAELVQGHVFFSFRDHMLRTGRQPPIDDVDIDAENAPGTWRAFTFLQGPANTDLGTFCNLPHGSRRELLASLSHVGPNLFAYRGASEVEGRVMAFFKVVSPDYPLTRRIEHRFNGDNPFFDSLGLSNVVEGRRIPFY